MPVLTALAAVALLLSWPRGAPLAAVGEVVRIDADSVLLASASGPAGLPGGRRWLPIAPVLARQLRVGDRIAAERPPGSGLISKVRFLHRAPPAPPPDDGSLPMGAPLPALVFPGLDGPAPLGEGQGTPTVLAFFFTTCGVPTACPMLAHKLRRLQAEIRGHGRIVTLTLDPETDTLVALRGYAAVHRAERGTWLIGRLELAELSPLLRRLGIARARSGDQLLHGLHVTLLDGQGRIVWRSNGSVWEVDELAGRLRALPRSAGSGT